MCSSSYHLAPLGFYRERVEQEIAEARSTQPEDALTLTAADINFPDVHIASACLQKTLRRGELEFALAAGRYLSRVDPDRLWRRLTVCAFEDFGLADLSVTARVVAAVSAKSWRIVQGEERVLAHLIGLLCALPKDRRLDDLYALGAAAFVARASSSVAESGALGGIVAPLVHETARLIASCERAVPRRSFRSIASEACERALLRLQRDGRLDDGLFELCSKGVRLSRCLLPVLLPLAIEATEASGGLGDAVEQVLAPVPLIGSVPAYAFDGFTRVGRSVLAQLLKSEPRLAQLVAHLAPSTRIDVLHHLLFAAEGGRCTPLISDALSETLWLGAITVGARRGLAEAQSAVALMAELLPTVHRLRALALSASTPTQPEELT